MEKPYPVAVMVDKKTVTIKWDIIAKTSATPSGGDKFNVEIGTLWALNKGFISTSKIVHAVFTATYFLNMTEGEMLWIIATKFLPDKTVEQVVQIAKKSMK